MDRDEIWSEKVTRSSKMKPRLRAEWVVLSDELLFIKLFFESYKQEFSRKRVKRFAVMEDIR